MNLSLLRGKKQYTDIHNCRTLEDVQWLIEQMSNSSQEDALCYQFFLGEIYYGVGDEEAARWKWEAAASADNPYRAWALKNIGDLMQENQLYDQALPYYDKIDAEGDIQKEKFYQTARCYKGLRQHEAAAPLYLNVLQHDPDYVFVYDEAKRFFSSCGMNDKLFMACYYKVRHSFDQDILDEAQTYLYQDIPLHKETVGDYLDMLITKLSDHAALYYMKHYLSFYSASSDVLDLLKRWLRRHPDLYALFIEMNYDYILQHSYQAYLFEEERVTEWLADWKEVADNTILEPYFYTLNNAYEGPVENGNEMTMVDSIFQAGVHIQQEISRFVRGLLLPFDKTMGFKLDHLMDDTRTNIMLTGTFNNGKTSFIHAQFGENVLKTDIMPTTSAVAMLEQKDVQQFYKMEEKTGLTMVGPDDIVQETTITKDNDSPYAYQLFYIETLAPQWKHPGIRLIDSPGSNDQGDIRNPVFDHAFYADRILYILSAEQAFRKNEKEFVEELKEKHPEMPVDFIINKIDFIEDEEEMEEVWEDAQKKIKKHVSPDAEVIPFSSEQQEYWQEEISDYFHRVEGLLNKENRVTYWLNDIKDIFEKLEMNYAEVTSAYKQKVLQKREALEALVQNQKNIESRQVFLQQQTENIVKDAVDEWYKQLERQVESIIQTWLDSQSSKIRVERLDQAFAANIMEEVYQHLSTTYFQQFLSCLQNSKSSIAEMMEQQLDEGWNISRPAIQTRVNQTFSQLLDHMKKQIHVVEEPSIVISKDDSWYQRLPKIIGNAGVTMKMKNEAYAHWLRNDGKDIICLNVQQYMFRTMHDVQLESAVVSAVLQPVLDEMKKNIQKIAGDLNHDKDRSDRLEEEYQSIVSGRGRRFMTVRQAMANTVYQPYVQSSKDKAVVQ